MPQRGIHLNKSGRGKAENDVVRFISVVAIFVRERALKYSSDVFVMGLETIGGKF